MLRINNLSGFGRRIAPPEAVNTLTFHASATGANSVVAPATIIAGDLLVFAQVAFGTGAPALVEPSGFTTINNMNNTPADDDTRVAVSYKVATGAEAGATLTGMTGSIGNQKIISVYRANIPIISAIPGGQASVWIATNPTPQVVPASGQVAPLLVYGVYVSEAPVSPRTFTPAETGELSIPSSFYFKYRPYDSAPADHTIDMDDEGVDNFLASGYIRVA